MCSSDLPGLTLDLWVNPPAYTGKAPIFLDDRQQQAEAPIEIPVRSVVLAQVNGLKSSPSLMVDDQATAFESLGPASHRATTTLVEGGRVAVAAGRLDPTPGALCVASVQHALAPYADACGLHHTGGTAG